VEIKYSDTPAKTKSMISALHELSLEHLWVVYPGTETYPMDKKITAIGLNNLRHLKI